MCLRLLLLGLIGGMFVAHESSAQGGCGDAQNCGPDANGMNSCYFDPSGYLVCNVQNNQCQLSGPCGLACDCFLAGTAVETEHGPRAIEDVQIGDLVLSASAEGALAYRPVTNRYVVWRGEFYVINGVIETTGEQRFWGRTGFGPEHAATREPLVGRRDGWINAADLRVGDELLGKDGNWCGVNSIQRIDRRVRAYNVEVEGWHSFFAGGVLVHNKEECGGIGP